MKLKLEHIRKEIKSKVIIEDFSVEVGEGEVCGLIGPNGAGKSTIIKIMCGLMEPDSGSVTLDGKVLDWYRKGQDYPIGCMIETPELYLNMTGINNLKIQALQKHIPRNEISVICQNVLEEAGIMKVKNKLVKTYSLGMKQRLGIAMCLMNQPRIVILDEPINGLDPDGIDYVRNLIKKLKKDGTSVIVSSHILKEMDDICDTFIFLKEGKIKKECNRKECKEDLETLYKKVIKEEE